MRVGVTRGVMACGLVVALWVHGCGSSGSSGGGAASVVAPIVSSAPAPITTITLGPGGAVTPAFRAAVARAFAPELRFNAYHDDGNRAPQNKNEDFFPLGVASFLAELERGAARVVVQPSDRHAVAVSQVRPFTSRPALSSAHLGGYPKFMAGDEPGTAPVYVHVYEDPAGRALAADGSGELVLHAEYWYFYAYDRSEAVLAFSLISTSGGDITGHRADWENVAYRLRLTLGPGGALLAGEVTHGTYYGHGHAFVIPGAGLQRVDDAGNDDPAGRHPVAYISQGKHAAYPEAGQFEGHSVPMWVAAHTDFFRGNGVRLQAWTAPLPDLEDAAALPQEFAPPAFTTLLATSAGSATTGLSDWTLYRGRFGPDLTILHLPFTSITLGLSPTGPKRKAYYGNKGGLSTYPLWTDVKAREPGLKAYADHGIVIPRVLPPPLPIRQ